MRKFAASAALVVSAVGIAAAPAYAAPAAPAPAPAVASPFQNVPASQTVDVNGIHYTLNRDGGSAVLKAVDGTFKKVGDSVTVANVKGTVVDSVPLVYRKDNTQFPINADITDHQVRLTPQTTGGTPVAHPISAAAMANAKDATKVDPKQIDESFSPRDQQELSAFGSRATISSLVGAVVGALIGVTVGCVAGGVVGSVSTAITTLFAGVLPGAIIGCIAGVATIGTVGTLLGTILVGGPMMLWSAYQYFSTINAPCTTPGAFCTNPAAPPAPVKK